MKATLTIIAVMFLITSCGGSKPGPVGSSSGPVVEGSDDALKICSIKFKQNDNEHETALKGHLVRSLCKIRTEEELLRKIALDLKN